MITPNNKPKRILILTLLIPILAISTIIALYPRPERFKIETISKTQKIEKNITIYNDLDNDNISERIRFDTDFGGMTSIIVEKQKTILYQLNFDKEFCVSTFYFSGDFDNNNQKEIYLFFNANDSIFLTAFDGITGEYILTNFYIDSFTKPNGVPDYNISDIQLAQLEPSSHVKLLFSIYCGFSKSIRHVYSVDIWNRKVSKTAEAGISIDRQVKTYNIDNDSLKEVFGHFPIYGNHKPDYPYSDMFGWLMVYTHDLNFKFEPYKIGIYPGTITTVPLIQNKFAVHYEYKGIKNDFSFIGIYDAFGNCLTKEYLKRQNNSECLLFESFPEKKPQFLRMVTTDGRVNIYNSYLSLKSSKNINFYDELYLSYDLNADGKMEYLMNNYSFNDFQIVDNNFDNPINISFEANKYQFFSILKCHEDAPKLNICTSNFNYVFRYTNNPYYYLYWVFMCLVFVFILGILLLLGKLNRNHIQRKYENEKNMGEMQLKAIKNQLDPHFTFNILNSIGGLFSNNNTEKANLLLGKYSKLLRQAIFQSGETETSLTEELNYVENYINLEQIRYNNSFTYAINSEPELDQTITIPKLLIHGFAENAIKHGLRHLKQNGILEINISKQKSTIAICISDNGIGREKAKQYSQLSTGKGLKIVNQTLDLYFKLKNKRITYKIIDLYNEKKKPTGTKIEILIPE